MLKRSVRLAWCRDPAAELLKVGHHGSKTSATPEFLAAVHPHYSVISVGAGNPFGLPKMEVLQRLVNSNVSTYRTDMDGAVTFFLDGVRVFESSSESVSDPLARSR